MTFADRLKQLREAAGLSQAGLASKCGLGLSTVTQYEQGLRQPSLEVGQRLAAAVGADCTAFNGCEFNTPPVKLRQPRGRPKKGESGATAGKAKGRGKKRGE